MVEEHQHEYEKMKMRKQEKIITRSTEVTSLDTWSTKVSVVEVDMFGTYQRLSTAEFLGSELRKKAIATQKLWATVSGRRWAKCRSTDFPT